MAMLDLVMGASLVLAIVTLVKTMEIYGLLGWLLIYALIMSGGYAAIKLILSAWPVVFAA